MVVDLLEVVIAYLAADANLNTEVAGRIAARHKFGLDADDGEDAWANPSNALTVSYTPGGTPDLYAGQQRSRLEARCYGGSQEQANEVYGALAELVEATERTPVAITSGNALLYYLVFDDSPEHVKDPDLNIDLARVFLRAACHRNLIP